MAVPTQLSDLNATAASNSPASTDTLSTTDDYIRALSSILARISAGTDKLATPSTTGAMDIGGNFSVATSKFTVAAATGNAKVAGSLELGIRSTQSTSDRVSVTGATTIYTPVTTGSSVGASAVLLFVNGYNTASPTTNSFCDLVSVVVGQTPVVISSNNKGAPAARTYSSSGSAVQCAMAAGTYNLAVSAIEQAC